MYINNTDPVPNGPLPPIQNRARWLLPMPIIKMQFSTELLMERLTERFPMTITPFMSRMGECV